MSDIKNNNKMENLSIIKMISASPNIRQLASKVGADDAIEKPFKMSELKEKIIILLS